MTLTTYFICIGFGAIGNLLTLFTMATADRKNKSGTNMFLISLAVSMNFYFFCKFMSNSTTIIYCGPIVSAFLKIELFSWFYIPLCVILLYACGWCLLFLFNKPLCLHKVCFLWLITLLCQNQSRMFVDCCCACLIDLLYSTVTLFLYNTYTY